MLMIRSVLLFLCLTVLSGCVVEKVTDRIGAPTQDSVSENNSTSSKGLYQGEFATLGTARTEIIVAAIKSENTDTINTVLLHPNDFTPPALYALADYLMSKNETFAAMFWHYTAQLRARSDANKSLDPSVRDGLTKLNSYYGHEIGVYAGTHLEQLKMAMEKVIEYDEIVDRSYDPRWIAVLGKDALSKDRIAFVTSSKYDEINKKTREGFYQGFLNVLKKTKATKNK